MSLVYGWLWVALGGSPKAISKLVFTDSAKPVVYGFLLSIAVLVAIYVYLTQQTDVKVSIEVSALIVTFVLISLTSFVACFIPLQRIVRGQPIKALK
jgi:ABC-type lipoprotein release transport system permease subunit